MIVKKEFYFVRHGQTDHNLLEGPNKGDHHGDTPLNQTGEGQAASIEPIIAVLPVETVCASPMKRAQQTKNIITPRLKAPHHEIEGLGECSAKVWQEMRVLGMYSPFPKAGEAYHFMERVKEGLNQALSLPGPTLIVSHGGVHWAACCLMDIKEHFWALENCGIVHFSVDSDGVWKARKLGAS